MSTLQTLCAALSPLLNLPANHPLVLSLARIYRDNTPLVRDVMESGEGEFALRYADGRLVVACESDNFHVLHRVEHW